ncbi:acylphosphatase [Candidatus Pacearchaeota archaeon]|nr:acylphosphatase [Candidatus Pacearchaeota archaeon]
MDASIHVFGRVQGVTFRKQVKNFALAENIHGYVENRHDGSVFIIAQGEKKSLFKLIRWVKSSPGISEVTKVTTSFTSLSHNYLSFSIRKHMSFFSDQMSSISHLVKRIVGGNDE